MKRFFIYNFTFAIVLIALLKCNFAGAQQLMNLLPPPQCSDEKDNDGDTLIDLKDPGCIDAKDNDEWPLNDTGETQKDKNSGCTIKVGTYRCAVENEECTSLLESLTRTIHKGICQTTAYKDTNNNIYYHCECSNCGNGYVEPALGEYCDPPLTSPSGCEPEEYCDESCQCVPVPDECTDKNKHPICAGQCTHLGKIGECTTDPMTGKCFCSQAH